MAREEPAGLEQGVGAGPSLTVPTGMEKAEEGEKHLADILALDITLDTGLVIPTPECTEIQSSDNRNGCTDDPKHETEVASVDNVNVYDKVRFKKLFHNSKILKSHFLDV